MHLLRKYFRNPVLLLLIGMLAVVALALIAFGAVYQGEASGRLLGLPGLWFASLIAFPFVVHVLLVIVWKRFDRIAR